MDNQPVSFPDWKHALRGAGLPPDLEATYAREIFGFLRHCKNLHAPATVILVRQYLDLRGKIDHGPGPGGIALVLPDGEIRRQSSAISDCRAAAISAGRS